MKCRLQIEVTVLMHRSLMAEQQQLQQEQWQESKVADSHTLQYIEAAEQQVKVAAEQG